MFGRNHLVVSAYGLFTLFNWNPSWLSTARGHVLYCSRSRGKQGKHQDFGSVSYYVGKTHRSENHNTNSNYEYLPHARVLGSSGLSSGLSSKITSCMELEDDHLPSRIHPKIQLSTRTAGHTTTRKPYLWYQQMVRSCTTQLTVARPGKPRTP